MSGPRLTCFVASAFDHPDVDRIYRSIIKPALRELDIVVARVDGIEHNDDIDDKIFSLLDDCDLCIADLTYARPSVYYEAGYAFGKGKPVIYLARSDHFRPRIEDPKGNLKVHFDLQMKNIIPWSSPCDSIRKKIIRRTRIVVAPLLRQRQEEQARKVHEAEFLSLSQSERLLRIREAAINCLRKQRFKRGNALHQTIRRPYDFWSFRKRGTRIQEVHFSCSNRFTKSDFRILEGFSMPRSSRVTRMEVFEVLCVFVSLQRTNKSTLESFLPGFRPISDNTLLMDRGFQDDNRVNTKVVFLSGINSLERLERELSDLFLRAHSRKEQSPV